MMAPILQTERLTPRMPDAADAMALGDFLVSQRAVWIGGPYPRAEAMEWITWDKDRWAKAGRGSWIVALPDGTPIGRVGFLDHDGWHEPELAWFLFDGFEGMGHAHEAAVAARDYATDTLKLPPLFSFIEAGNLRSKALAERLGATPERAVDFKGIRLTVYRHPAAGAVA